MAGKEGWREEGGWQARGGGGGRKERVLDKIEEDSYEERGEIYGVGITSDWQFSDGGRQGRGRGVDPTVGLR